MVDPVGAALGLAALFTTCLEVWDFVDAGRAHATNFSLLRTKLDNQRILFVIWGKKVQFGSESGEYDRRLDDPFIAPTIESNLNHIRRIFSDTDAMVDRYGIAITRKRKSHRYGTSSSQHAIFQSGYKQFLGQLKQDQKSTSFWKKTRWSIKDEKRFDTMVKDISELVVGLERITEAFISQAKADQLLNLAMENIEDLESLAEVQ